MTDAIILAGTSKPTELTVVEQVDNKAFILISGSIMLQYVLQAIRQANGIGRIAVVGPRQELAAHIKDPDVLLIDEGKTIVENLSRGVSALQPTEHFLVCSADVPFLTPKAVEGLIYACKPYSQDLYYPIVHRFENDRRFPGVRRTYVKLIEGEFTGGNLFVVNPECLDRALPRLEEIFALRKSPLRLAGLLGFGFVFRLLARRLTIRELEERFSLLFAIRAKAVILQYPEIGTDVDKLSDLSLARSILL